MNIKIGYTANFIAGVWWSNQLILSTYTATFKLMTVTMDPAKSNIALDRLKYFVEEALQDTIFINQAETKQIKLLAQAGIKTTALPEEPVDQIIGMMLYSKINAIMEDNLIVRSVLISSTAGDNVIYEHDQEESCDPFNKPGWWNDSGPDHTFDIAVKKTNDKVFIIAPKVNWRDLGLDWEPPEDDENNATVLEFKNDKDK